MSETSEIPQSPPEGGIATEKPVPTAAEQKKQEPEEKDPFKLEIEGAGDEIRELLKRENFIAHDNDDLIRQLEDPNRRFATLVGFRREEGRELPVKRFFKGPLPQQDPERDEKTRLAFQRQTLAHYYLDMHTEVPLAEIFEFNADPSKGPMYAVMATYEEGSGIGFLRGYEDIGKLTPKHARLAVRAIRGLAHQENGITPELAEVLDKRPAYQDFEGFEGNMTAILDKPVIGAGKPHSEDKRPLHKILEERTRIGGFREKALSLVACLKTTIEEGQKGIHLVHGDLAPNNLFLGDGIKAEELMFLDFEWAGISGNQILAEAYDFGNLRARSWTNEEFRDSLDKEMIESYASEGREDIGRAIVTLGILRSHMNLAGFFENYPPEKSEQQIQIERREATEKDIAKAWEVLGLNPKA
ncbi:MAG: hypothetical protein A2172_01535 [Candidatus Woykebacteria bacterium RBG_13_40_15]|uniref:Aminoglycoside phosphotransferase domain-containing protein n=1 Tax=Candidatus Woykebacteria bacterium RBG_13_40_15 TaxID=1802593 RepID=A0A1G1W9A4_9BACT|nr:MAG: hypothetical protein A2172_01535 [Candidatus Woykebacteria bacterium RBG_13_40_15]